MAGKYCLILLLGVLSSCAQIGTISGGEKDRFAPKPISEEVSPKNETVLFTGNKVIIPFDEFIKLNNPSKTIIMVPPHARINSEVKGKELHLTWKENLQANTTYAIYLNGAIKDITEGNDSVLQYVFSTGDYIDTLSYSTTVVDVKTAKPVRNCTVALFSSSTNEIINFSRTDSKGLAKLSYIRPGNYSVYAFLDENQNLTIDSQESVGFPESRFLLLDTTAVIDSAPIRLFKPQITPKIRTNTYIAPASFVIGTTRSIEEEIIYVNGSIISESRVKKIAMDSVQIFLHSDSIVSGNIVIKSKYLTDTSSYRIVDSKKSNNLFIENKNKGNTILPNELAIFNVNDYILTVDTTAISVINTSDSTKVSYTVHSSFNELSFTFNKSSLENVTIIFEKGAIKTINGESKFSTSTLTVGHPKKYGVIHVDCSSFGAPIIVQLISSGKMIKQEAILTGSEDIQFNDLPSGEYSLKVVLDENMNGLWDTGDLLEHKQAEKIYHFTDLIKVRANWEVSTKLIQKE